MMETHFIKIKSLERDGDDGLIVDLSDGTTAAYLVEELLELRPHREPTDASIPVRKNKSGRSIAPRP